MRKSPCRVSYWGHLLETVARRDRHVSIAARIREHFGYRDFTEPSTYFQPLRWLYARAWVTSQSPSMLFDLATVWLVERKVLLPGTSVLARLVAGVRDRTSARLWKRLSWAIAPEQREQL